MKTIEKTKKTFTALDTTAIVNDLKEKILGLRFLFPYKNPLIFSLEL